MLAHIPKCSEILVFTDQTNVLPRVTIWHTIRVFAVNADEGPAERFWAIDIFDNNVRVITLRNESCASTKAEALVNAALLGCSAAQKLENALVSKS